MSEMESGKKSRKHFCKKEPPLHEGAGKANRENTHLWVCEMKEMKLSWELWGQKVAEDLDRDPGSHLEA